MTRALNFACDRAGNSRAARIAIMAITTSSSMRVNAEQRKNLFELICASCNFGTEAEAKAACILLSEPTIQLLVQEGVSVQWMILSRAWRMLSGWKGAQQPTNSVE